MATGGEGNEGQMQLGYGSRVWGTGRVTVCPPGPGGATQRSSVEGTVSDQDELHQSRSHGEEDVTQSPPVPGRRGQSGDEMEVVIRSQWQQHASAGEQGQGVTQLAAHSIADGKRSSALHGDFCEEGAGAVAQSLSQFWRAGMLAASRRRQASRFRWPNLMTAVGLPLQTVTEISNRFLQDQ